MGINDCQPSVHAPKRRGGTLLYAMIILAALLAFCSLAVDWGRVQSAKSELQAVADAAARAGVSSLGSGSTAARNAAISMAGSSTVDGQTVTLQSSDVAVGKWDAIAHTLDTASGSPDAVKVIAQRTKARGNAIPLMFARILGLTQADIQSVAVARTSAALPAGITGLNSISFGQNFFAAGYNSGFSTSPSRTAYRTSGLLASNGVVGLGAFGIASNIYGNVKVGPLGNLFSNVAVSGVVSQLAAPLTASPATITPVANPYGLSTVVGYAGGGTYSLPGGAYYFTSVSIADDISVSFTSPATVYLDGNVTMNDRNHIVAYNGVPSNLVIYQAPGKSITVRDDCSVTAVVVAPGADFTARDRFVFQGGMSTLTSKFGNDCSLYCDETLSTSGMVLLVK